MKYKHYLVTRFNLRVHYGCKLRNPENNPMLRIFDEDYLEERFNIFEKYTLPSIKNQINQNFTWIVLFHKNTPNAFIKRINELKKIYEFDDYYFDDGEEFTSLNFCTKNDDYDFFITSRVDNDDMLEKTFIKRIQDFADNNLRKCIISFPHGEKLDLRTNKKYHYIRKDNPFCSLISHKGTSILRYNHSKILENNNDVIFFETEHPMWTATIHESNVNNQIEKNDIKHEIN